jgi:hypothetical protein
MIAPKRGTFVPDMGTKITHSLLRLNFLQKWKENLKIWNSRNQEIIVFTFVSSCLR